MQLAESRGRFLFEVCPDLIPEGYLTDLEMSLWGLFYNERAEDRKRTQRG